MRYLIGRLNSDLSTNLIRQYQMSLNRPTITMDFSRIQVTFFGCRLTRSSFAQFGHRPSKLLSSIYVAGYYS